MRLVVAFAALALGACGPSLDEQFEQTMRESIAATEDEASKSGFRQMLQHKDQMSDEEKQQFVEMWAAIKERQAHLKESVQDAKDSGEMSGADADNILANVDTL